ncbi:hypothetical protein HZB78_04895 [Candidatus Collierbacteria bacterium]|nr:hypothetical protein [Candidatus Collierbacteria bacterium]
MEFIGWEVIFEGKEAIGYKSGTNGDLWFCKVGLAKTSDYDQKGVNHISIRVENLADVDETKNYLEKNSVKMLFDTSRYRPEFTSRDDENYYQIMFESPDRVLFEIVYIGTK